MENIVSKQLLEEYLKKFELENYNNLDRIRELEDTIGMSIAEFEELNKLYDIFYENSVKIKFIKEILNWGVSNEKR